MAEATQLLHGLGIEKRIRTAQKTFSFASSILNLPFSTDLVSWSKTYQLWSNFHPDLFSQFYTSMMDFSPNLYNVLAQQVHIINLSWNAEVKNRMHVDIQPLHILQDDPDDYIGAAKVSILCLKTLDAAMKEGTFVHIYLALQRNLIKIYVICY